MAKPIFARGVSPLYDRRTLRPPELEGLRNLPQKFHFPYWGRKGKENKSRPSKTRRSAAQTNICAAARTGFLREVRPHLGLGKNKNTPKRKAKTRQSAAQTSICAAARTGFFTGGSPTSWVREKQKHPQAQSQNAPECRPDGHLRRRAGGLFTGGSSTSWVREKQKHPQAQSQNAPECRSDGHLRRGAGGHYTAAYMSGRAAAQSGVSAALWRVLAEGADPAVSPGETYGYGRPPVRTAFHVYLSAMRPDYRLDYRHSQAVSVSFRGVVGLEKL